MMAYGLNTWLPKMMQQMGFSITSSLSFNLVLCLGQIAGSLIGGYFAGKVGSSKSSCYRCSSLVQLPLSH